MQGKPIRQAEGQKGAPAPFSRKQLAANRQNAQLSTGPKTEPGKNASSQNAVKHGLYSRSAIINSPNLKEDPEEYELLYQSMCGELKPRTLFQKYLVRKITNCLWRSQRAITAETAQLNKQMANIDSALDQSTTITRILDSLTNTDYSESAPDDESISSANMLSTADRRPKGHPCADDESFRRANMIGLKSIPYEDVSRNILRYEMRLDRQMTRAYLLLRHLQLHQQKDKIYNSRNK